MSQLIVGDQCKVSLATELASLSQAEQDTQADILKETESTLTPAWKDRAQASPEVGEHTAWQLVWMKLLEKDYVGAAIWLYYVDDLPTVSRQTWQIQRAALVDMCEQLQHSFATNGHRTETNLKPDGSIFVSTEATANQQAQGTTSADTVQLNQFVFPPSHAVDGVPQPLKVRS